MDVKKSVCPPPLRDDPCFVIEDPGGVADNQRQQLVSGQFGVQKPQEKPVSPQASPVQHVCTNVRCGASALEACFLV